MEYLNDELTDTNLIVSKGFIESAISNAKAEDVKQYTFCILLLDKEYKDIVENLISKYGHSINTVDAVLHCWNLNDDWYELHKVICVATFGGFYPIDWELDDVYLLDELYNTRKIFINVFD